MSSNSDIHSIQSDFPIFKQHINDQPLVYLDNAATTQKPQAVIQAITDYYQQHNANIHRGLHTLAEHATQQFEAARATVQHFIKATSSQEIIFTRGTTESLNLVAQSWALPRLKAGDTIVLTQMEHHANLLPWQRVAQQTGAELRFIPVNAQGQLVEDWPTYIDQKTKIVSFSHISNLLGTINPADQIIAAAHAVGAIAIVDAAQSAPHAMVDVANLQADFVAFSGHKIFGPTGIGVLYGRQELLEQMEPYQLGGQMIESANWQSATWNELPWKFEAGTPHIAGAIALAAAIDYLQQFQPSQIWQHQHELAEYGLEKLQSVSGLTLYGPTDPADRIPLFSFSLQGLHPHDIASLLDQQGIAVRSGHHCAQPLTNFLQVPATTRASLYLYNTTQDIDRLADGLIDVQHKLAKDS